MWSPACNEVESSFGESRNSVVSAGFAPKTSRRTTTSRRSGRTLSTTPLTRSECAEAAPSQSVVAKNRLHSVRGAKRRHATRELSTITVFAAALRTTAAAAERRSAAVGLGSAADGPQSAGMAGFGGCPASLDSRRAHRRAARILRTPDHCDRAADRGGVLRAVADRAAVATAGDRIAYRADLRVRGDRFLGVRDRVDRAFRTRAARDVRADLHRGWLRPIPLFAQGAAGVLRRRSELRPGSARRMAAARVAAIDRATRAVARDGRVQPVWRHS